MSLFHGHEIDSTWKEIYSVKFKKTVQFCQYAKILSQERLYIRTILHVAPTYLLHAISSFSSARDLSVSAGERPSDKVKDEEIPDRYLFVISS